MHVSLKTTPSPAIVLDTESIKLSVRVLAWQHTTLYPAAGSLGTSFVDRAYESEMSVIQYCVRVYRTDVQKQYCTSNSDVVTLALGSAAEPSTTTHNAFLVITLAN